MSQSLQAAEAYLQSSVENAPPIQIIRMLYQGAIRFILQAEGEDEKVPTSAFVENLSNADAIVAELRLALKSDGQNQDLVQNLQQLYLFCEGELQTAMIDRTKAPLGGVQRVLRTLLDAWNQVEVQAQAA